MTRTNGRQILNGELVPSIEIEPSAISKTIRQEMTRSIPSSEEIRHVIKESTEALANTLREAVALTKDTCFRINVEEETSIIERF